MGRVSSGRWRNPAVGAFPEFSKLAPSGSYPFGLGITILATSRPWKRVHLLHPGSRWLLWWYFRQRDSARRTNAIRVFWRWLWRCVCAVGLVFVLQLANHEESSSFSHCRLKCMNIWSRRFSCGSMRSRLTPTLILQFLFYKSSLPWNLHRGGAKSKNLPDKSSRVFGIFLGPVFSIPFITLPWLTYSCAPGARAIRTFGCRTLPPLCSFIPHYAGAWVMVNIVLLRDTGMRRADVGFRRRPFGDFVGAIDRFNQRARQVPANLLFFRYPAFMDADTWESSFCRYFLPCGHISGALAVEVTARKLRIWLDERIARSLSNSDWSFWRFGKFALG